MGSFPPYSRECDAGLNLPASQYREETAGVFSGPCQPCHARTWKTRECGILETQARDWGAFVTGGTSDHYFDPCLGEYRCRLGNFVDEEQRLVWQGQLLELRNRALLYYGPYDSPAKTQQYADAVLRYWNGFGPGTTSYETWDLGPDITRETFVAAGMNPNVLAAYDDALVLAGVMPLLVGHLGPIERGILDGEANRLENFGAIAAQNWRDLHPWGELRDGDELPGQEPGIYWVPFDTMVPPQFVAESVDALGDDLETIGITWGLTGDANWVAKWRDVREAAGWIMFARIMHAIGAAHLAAFPVTSQWAAPAYAAGNALIDIGAGAFYGDIAWADSLKALMDAGVDFYGVGMEGLEDPDKPPKSEVDKAKVDNNIETSATGQVTGGNYENEAKTANAGKEGDTTAAQETYAWTVASGNAADAAVEGDWEGVAAAFEEQGFDLPPEFYENLLEDLGTVTGFSDSVYGGGGVNGTASGTTNGRTTAGPRSQGRNLGAFTLGTPIVKKKRSPTAGPVPGSPMGVARMTAALGLGAEDKEEVRGDNTAVILGVLALVLGLAWIM